MSLNLRMMHLLVYKGSLMFPKYAGQQERDVVTARDSPIEVMEMDVERIYQIIELL